MWSVFDGIDRFFGIVLVLFVHGKLILRKAMATKIPQSIFLHIHKVGDRFFEPLDHQSYVSIFQINACFFFEMEKNSQDDSPK